MFTVRNTGLEVSMRVEWYGVTQEESSNCTYHEQNLNGNDNQINNVCTPENESGEQDHLYL